MPSPDLRGLFRTNNRAVAPVDVFANRAEEWAATVRSVQRCVALAHDPAFDVEDVQAPRRNVLAFYGVGGIGKTTLSQRIYTHLVDPENGPDHWPPLPSGLKRVLPVRVDLSRQLDAGLETILLSIRLTVAALGRPMPAFDLAFQRYWEHNHPGEPLDEFLRRHTYFSRFSQRDGLRAQMESALADIAQAAALPGTIGAVAGQSLRVIVRTLRERRQKARAMAGCSRLPDLLEAEPDQDALSFYPHLLAWDLAQLPAEQTATLVVLLDTFEDVGDRTHRDVERLIQRLAWLMPASLFVITGRNRLQWDDPSLEGQLDWAGPAYWPQLVRGANEDPRQYRIGYLSEEDSEDYLRRRLTLDQQPLMDDATRRAIISRSGGLPLCLDLAVMRFLDLYERHGHAPDVSEFDHDFPALVARTFRDLTPDERHMLRAVSLLDSFSIELATAAAGMDRDAPALQLVERPFVESEPAAPWPFHLHDLVRSAVRDADVTAEDRWSDADWQRAARRTLAALGAEYKERRRTDGDRRWLIGCLRQGLRLARDFDLDLDWLADAAFAYVSDFVWEPIEIGPEPTTTAGSASPAIGSPAVALAETLAAVARRQRQHRAATAGRLQAVLDSGLLPEDLVELPLYFLAECDRDLGNLEASLAGMRQVADLGGRLAPDANRGLIHLARRVGMFTDVLAATESLGTAGKYHRTLGELWWTQGSISVACNAFAAARDEALEQDQRGEAALSQAYLAFAASFQDRARAEEQITHAERLLAGANARFAELQVRNARLLQQAGYADDLPTQAEQVATAARTNGLTSSVAYARFAACFHAAVRNEPGLIRESRALLAECVRGAEFAYLVELAYLMTEEQPPAELPRAQWIDGLETTGRRWSDLVAERRQQTTALGE